MKNLTVFVLISLIALTGCSKKEESSTVATDTTPTPVVDEAPAVQEAEEEVAEAASVSSTSTTNSLMPTTESVKDLVPDTKEAETVATSEADKMATQKTVENVEEETSGSDLMGQASALASSINWQDMSWDQVSEIPYENKAELATWAASQVDQWKGKLADSAKTQGLSMLSNLGDTGWQGALSNVVDAIDDVRQSNPDTWELARGALVSSWETFQVKAMDVLGN